MVDRIDTIAAAAITGWLARTGDFSPRPEGKALDDLARWALELGQRYHALRTPEPATPAAERPGHVHVHLVKDPAIVPVPVCTDANVRPFAFPPGLKAVDVMGEIS